MGDNTRTVEASPDAFLLETEYCDISNPSITKIANEFQTKYPDDKERAIKLFLFVRDHVKYRLGAWSKKASTTLREGFGMCTSSTNLLVALLRASKIPAGYCIYQVRGGESFGHILPKIIKRNIDKDSVHIVAYVYLKKRWIKCDASTDIQFSEQSSHLSEITKLINWDGENDDVHLMPSEHIINISKPLANIDFQLEKKPRNFTKTFSFHVGNSFIDFLRASGHKVQTSAHAESEFEKWYRRRHYVRYLLLKIYATKTINNVQELVRRKKRKIIDRDEKYR